MIIEVKLEKIEKGDDESITAAHKRNLSQARKQIRCYTWKDATEDIIQRVVVSGVWHPSMKKSESHVPYKLSSRYEFLQRKGPSHTQGRKRKK